MATAYPSYISPLNTRIKVANGTKLKLLGRWFGTVQVGNISAESWFEVSNSHGAFDIILGKPWLRQVKAIHNYDTDTLTISQGKISETVMNEAPQAPSLTTNTTENETEKVETKTEKAPPSSNLPKPILTNVKHTPNHHCVPPGTKPNASRSSSRKERL